MTSDLRHETLNFSYKKVILRFPTIDAVEVVRCKDCKYCECLQDSFKNNFYFCINTINNAEVKADDYCSYSERKEDITHV